MMHAYFGRKIFDLNFFKLQSNQTSISITTFLVAMKLSLVLIFSNLISWKIYEIYLTEVF